MTTKMMLPNDESNELVSLRGDFLFSLSASGDACYGAVIGKRRYYNPPTNRVVDDIESLKTIDVLGRIRQYSDMRTCIDRKRKLAVYDATHVDSLVSWYHCSQMERPKKAKPKLEPKSVVWGAGNRCQEKPYRRKFMLAGIIQSEQTEQWFQKYAGSTADRILDFCKTHDIVNEVKSAVSLAEKCFQTLPPDVRIEEDIDPETDDRQIRISLSVRDKSRQEVLACYRDFRRRLTNALPVEKGTFIRLSYDIS